MGFFKPSSFFFNNNDVLSFIFNFKVVYSSFMSEKERSPQRHVPNPSGAPRSMQDLLFAKNIANFYRAENGNPRGGVPSRKFVNRNKSPRTKKFKT